MNQAEVVLAFEQVAKRFRRKQVLEGIDLALEPGTVTVLLGENGAGKSTLLRLAHGLLLPNAGRVRVCGLDPARAGRKARELVGYVPDRPDAPRWMRTRELYRFLGAQYPTWDARVAERMAERLRVPLDARFADMSLGQATKAQLVAAMAHGPRLLLLDEPFSGLDAASREELLRAFLEELEPAGRAVLVATHDLGVAARVADRVLVLEGGRIAREEAMEDVQDEGAAARLRALLQTERRVPA
jgi:ABC-2 type transport system ATP-binding protein